MSESKCKACFDFAERSKYLSHENERQSSLKATNNTYYNTRELS